MVIAISAKKLTIQNVKGLVGVRGRNSDNKLIKAKLGWAPSYPLYKGMETTYRWVDEQIKNNNYPAEKLKALIGPSHYLFANCYLNHFSLKCYLRRALPLQLMEKIVIDSDKAIVGLKP